jgi:NAD(P)-dependent dehydrogenase (short-subunit alcohol dehydrogenase family)
LRDGTQGKTPTIFIVDWQAIARVMQKQCVTNIFHMRSVNGVLASDAASYITGEVITKDGGRMALNDTVKI